MVGGYAIPEVNRLMHAFMDGAREVNPDVKFLVNFIDSWYDPPKQRKVLRYDGCWRRRNVCGKIWCF